MSLIFEVKVSPASGRKQWSLDKNGTLKCALTSAPEKGKANKELIEFISETLSIPKKEIIIVHGLTSRQKKVSIPLTINFNELITKLGIERQQTLF